jgi:hypothetical protein
MQRKLTRLALISAASMAVTALFCLDLGLSFSASGNALGSGTTWLETCLNGPRGGSFNAGKFSPNGSGAGISALNARFSLATSGEDSGFRFVQ